MRKRKLRLKLLALLKVECPPNGLDNQELCPNDYAEMEELLPQQWGWALFHKDFPYDEDTDTWNQDDGGYSESGYWRFRFY